MQDSRGQYAIEDYLTPFTITTQFHAAMLHTNKLYVNVVMILLPLHSLISRC